MTAFDQEVELIAKVLCYKDGYAPDRLEPGNCIWQPWMDETKAMEADYDHLFDNGKIPPDGIKNDDSCHFMWRQYIWAARAVLNALNNHRILGS